MESVELAPMTRALCHALYRDWENDPDICPDPSRFRPYVYDEAAVDRYFDSRQTPDRMLFAVLLRGAPIGEVQLKRIDREAGVCTLSIHLQNDRVKNLGYGTRAERLAVEYAFDRLGLKAVLADALIGNTRSQHVLEKAGFERIGEDAGFRYYRIDR